MAQQKAQAKTVTAKKPAEKPAATPAVALVPEAPAEPKRRGRPPGWPRVIATCKWRELQVRSFRAAAPGEPTRSPANYGGHMVRGYTGPA